MIASALLETHKHSFEKLLETFAVWNKTMNLSSFKTSEEIWKKHFLDSLLPTSQVDFNHQKILDLGTGGGFPALPLAICFPESSFLALDSVGKKLKAVEAMAEDLSLENIKTIHARAEDLALERNYRGKFDMVVSRAVAPWPTLLELALPFVKIGGTFLAYQGPKILENLEQYADLETKFGGKFLNIFIVEDDPNEVPRQFVVIKKVSKTSMIFPRKNNLPRKSPLQ